MNTIMRTVGGAFGAQVAAAIVTGHLEPGTRYAAESGFTPRSRWERPRWSSRRRPPR
jgi:hypothetical protein